MNERALQAAARRLPALLGAHVAVTGLALVLGAALGLGLALLLHRRPRPRAIALGAAAILQTIPSLALLALMVPLLGAFGFWPALVALVLYGVLPVLRNTIAGLDGVPNDAIEAADAVGMTARQRLHLVELPIALPVVLAGVRTGAAWVVGTATLTTPVGQPSLGDLVFAGLQTRDWAAVTVGCVAAAALALVLDGLLAALEAAARARSRGRGLAAGLALVAVFAVGGVAARAESPLLATAGDTSKRATEHAGANPDAPTKKRPVVVGAKTFTEQYVLAELIAARLSAHGVAVERRFSLGSSIALDALVNGQVGVYVDYTGTLWANALARAEVAPRWRVNAAISAWLADTHRARMLGPLGFENAYAIAMRRSRATELGVATIGDLGPHAPSMRLGADYEFFQRPEWSRVRDAYDLRFVDVRSFDSSFLYEALSKGEVEAIAAYSSDGRVDLHELVLLEDTLPALPPYDAVLLLAPDLADDVEVVAALAPLVEAIPVEAIRRATLMVDRDHDKRTLVEAATWLERETVGPAGAPRQPRPKIP